MYSSSDASELTYSDDYEDFTEDRRYWSHYGYDETESEEEVISEDENEAEEEVISEDDVKSLPKKSSAAYLSGTEFNNLFPDISFVLLTNSDEVHNDYKFNDGININTSKFNDGINIINTSKTKKRPYRQGHISELLFIKEKNIIP